MKRAILLFLTFIFNFGGSTAFSLLVSYYGFTNDAAGDYFFFGERLSWCTAIWALYLFAIQAKKATTTELELIRWIVMMVIYCAWKEITGTARNFDGSGYALLCVITGSLIYRLFIRQRLHRKFKLSHK